MSGLGTNKAPSIVDVKSRRAIPSPPERRPDRPGIRVRDLALRFGEDMVFDGVTFDIAGGEFVALLGPSGVGKSSLLKIVAGLIPATAGTVTGTDDLPIHNRIAYMGQQDLLLPWLNVTENVTLGARLRGERADMAWAERLLERVGLAKRSKSYPFELSGGMRQRAAIARTLYERQPIVLMDEPFSALDAVSRALVQDLAAELLADRTVLLITHDPMEACRLGHHLLMLTGHPARLGPPIRIVGEPPRALTDPIVLKTQAEILRVFMEAAK